jgi:hypothetical protein
MDYLTNASESLAKTKQIEVTNTEILLNRIQFWISPVKIILYPVQAIANFYQSIIDEGRNSVLSEKLSKQGLIDLALDQEARSVEMEAIRAIQLEQLHEQAKAPQLTHRQVINRRNASAPRKSRKQA